MTGGRPSLALQTSGPQASSRNAEIRAEMAWAPGPSEPSSQFKAGPPTPSPGAGGPEAFPSSRARWSLELRGGPQEGLQEHVTSKTALEEKREVQRGPHSKVAWPGYFWDQQRGGVCEAALGPSGPGGGEH